MKLIILSALTFICSLSLAAPPAMSEMTPEQRKNMAEMHAKMSACLNSTRPLQECREEMMKDWPHMGMGKMMGKHWGCPMMGESPTTEPKTKVTK